MITVRVTSEDGSLVLRFNFISVESMHRSSTCDAESAGWESKEVGSLTYMVELCSTECEFLSLIGVAGASALIGVEAPMHK